MSFKKFVLKTIHSINPTYFEGRSYRTLNQLGIDDVVDGKLIFSDEVTPPEPIAVNEVDESNQTPIFEKNGIITIDNLPPRHKLQHTSVIEQWLEHDKDHRWIKGVNPNCFTSSGCSAVYVYENHLLVVENIRDNYANKYNIPETEEQFKSVLV